MGSSLVPNGTSMVPNMASTIAPLGDLLKTFQNSRDAAQKSGIEEQKRMTLADLAQQGGTPDYAQTGMKLIGLGDVQNGAAFLKLAEEQKTKQAQMQAATQFGQLFGGGSSMQNGMGQQSQSQQPRGVQFANSEADVQRLEGSNPSDMSSYRNAIASIESRGSGDYNAMGPVTNRGDRAYGKYQVMGSNIGPWSEAALGRRVTPQEFISNPELQDKIFDHQFGSYVKQYGNPQDAASAWFTGRPQSQGGNSRDQLGTSGNAYVQKFNNALGSDMPAQNAQQAQFQIPGEQGRQRGQSNGLPPGDPAPNIQTPQLLQLMMNPNLPEAQRTLAKSVYENRQKFLQEDTKATDVQRNYNLAKSQGYQGTFLDYQRELKAGTTINLKNEGSIPSGYRAVRDAQGNVMQMEPIPGGPAAQEVSDAAKKREYAAGMKAQGADAVINALNDIDKLQASAALPAVGPAGVAIAEKSPFSTNANDIKQSLLTIKSNIGFDRLQQMRESSPTGGALGQVSDTENRLLQSVFGALEQSQSKEQFNVNLGRIRSLYEKTIHGRALSAGERKLGGPLTSERASQIKADADAAIANGADKAKVYKRLKEYGVIGGGN